MGWRTLVALPLLTPCTRTWASRFEHASLPTSTLGFACCKITRKAVLPLLFVFCSIRQHPVLILLVAQSINSMAVKNDAMGSQAWVHCFACHQAMSRAVYLKALHIGCSCCLCMHHVTVYNKVHDKPYKSSSSSPTLCIVPIANEEAQRLLVKTAVLEVHLPVDKLTQV